MFCAGIMWLTDYDNVLYQTLKDQALNKAMMAFMVILLIIRKVRLWNIESLVGSVLTVIGGHFYLKEVELSPSVLVSRRYVVVVCWLLLMMIIDAVKYKKYETLKYCNPVGLTLFFVTTLTMLTLRNGSKDPLLMLIVFGMLFTTSLSKREWQELLICLCNGWFIVSVLLIGKSLLENYPYETERFYGCFINIGPFGIFLLCSMMISLYGMYYLKRNKGWKHPMCWINMIWFVLITVVMLMTYTVTMLCGLGFVILALFFFARKNLSRKRLLLRLTALAGIVATVLVALLIAGQNVEYMAAYWHEKYLENQHNSFVYFMYRFYRSFVTDVDYNSMQAMGLAGYDGLLGVLNNFSSGRLYIWQQFISCFSFEGNPSYGIQVGEYLAYNAHCEYVQTLYRFGYLGGGLNIALYLYGMVGSVRRYLKTKEQTSFLAVLWLAGMFGAWLGECVNVSYPITFTGLFLMYPLMQNIDNLSE